VKEATSSRLPDFYNLSPSERRKLISDRVHLSEDQLDALSGHTALQVEQADHMIENTIGIFSLPLGIAVNFIVNGKEVRCVRIFSPYRTKEWQLSIRSREELEQHPEMLLFEGHIDRQGSVYVADRRMPLRRVIAK